MDILPPGEREGEGGRPRVSMGMELRGKVAMEEAKESLRRKAYSLACLPSVLIGSAVCPVPSLFTHSLSRSVSCFRAFQDAHTLFLFPPPSMSLGDSRGRSFMAPPRSQRMGKGRMLKVVLKLIGSNN